MLSILAMTKVSSGKETCVSWVSPMLHHLVKRHRIMSWKVYFHFNHGLGTYTCHNLKVIDDALVNLELDNEQ